MKKVMYWCTLPVQIPLMISLMIVWCIGKFITTVVEKTSNALTYFEGWCHDLHKQGYEFKDGFWVGHWKNVSGKFVNIKEE